MNVLHIHNIEAIKGQRTIHSDFQSLTLKAIDDEGRETTIIFFMDKPVVIEFNSTDTDRSYE